jgi:hypothetical protein
MQETASPTTAGKYRRKPQPDLPVGSKKSRAAKRRGLFYGYSWNTDASARRPVTLIFGNAAIHGKAAHLVLFSGRSGQD